jgi:hypothetical protein
MAVRTRFRRAIASLPGARWLKRRLVGTAPSVPATTARGAVPGSREQARGPRSCANGGSGSTARKLSAKPAHPRARYFRFVPHHRQRSTATAHALGQSLRNLGFILEHEPVLPDCDKRFVVNRIVDAEMEKSVLNLLDQSGCRYLHIPFEREVYRNIPWDIEGVPTEFAPWTKRFAELGRDYQGRALMRLYRHKNNYVMNNNGARNAALRDGRRRWPSGCCPGTATVSSPRRPGTRSPQRCGPRRSFRISSCRWRASRITPDCSRANTGQRRCEEPQMIFPEQRRTGVRSGISIRPASEGQSACGGSACRGLGRLERSSPGTRRVRPSRRRPALSVRPGWVATVLRTGRSSKPSGTRGQPSSSIAGRPESRRLNVCSTRSTIRYASDVTTESQTNRA